MESELRVLSSVQNGDHEATLIVLQQQLEDIRINTDGVIVEDFSSTTIQKYSVNTSLIFLPLTLKADQLVYCSGHSVDKLLPVLPLVALVIAAQQIDLDAEAEQGIAGVLAEAEDKLNPAPELAKQAKEEVQTINLSLKDNLKALLEMCQHGSEEEWTNVYNKLLKFRQQLDKAIRRSAKAKEKMESEKPQFEQLHKKYHINDSAEQENEDGA
ncbi:MAG: hypothetical protein ACJAXN_002409 [Psychromonas sp.]|jgi:hypothetical protein